MANPAKTHAPSRRRDGLSRTQERTQCGRIITRGLGARSGPAFASVGETPTCKRCSVGGAR